MCRTQTPNYIVESLKQIRRIHGSLCLRFFPGNEQNDICALTWQSSKRISRLHFDLCLKVSPNFMVKIGEAFFVVNLKHISRPRQRHIKDTFNRTGPAGEQDDFVRQSDRLG